MFGLYLDEDQLEDFALWAFEPVGGSIFIDVRKRWNEVHGDKFMLLPEVKFSSEDVKKMAELYRERKLKCCDQYLKRYKSSKDLDFKDLYYKCRSIIISMRTNIKDARIEYISPEKYNQISQEAIKLNKELGLE